MAKSTAYAVGRLVEAIDSLSKAADHIVSARLQTVQASGGGPGDFRGTDLDRRLDSLAGRLTKDSFDLEDDVKRLAELIPSRAGSDSTEGGD